jgi:chorismate mutase-like protein
MTIEDWRAKIDALDKQVLDLLTERVKCVIEVGKIKGQQNAQVFNPERERQIIQKLLSENKGPLDDGGLRRIFERIIEEMRRIEQEHS